MCLPLELRDCSFHELVEQRDSECHIAIRWTVDHSLPDQVSANGTKTHQLHFEDFRDVACALWIGTNVPHRTQESAPPGSKPVVTNFEEVLVEPHGDGCCSFLD